MIYSPFNQNNFQGFETYNSQVLLAKNVDTQYYDNQNRSSNKIISKSLVAIYNEKNEPQIKEHFFYAKESNILMGKPVISVIDTPIYIPKYNSQNDPSIHISIGDVSDNVISQHTIYNYTPQNLNYASGKSSENSLEAGNYLKLNPYKDVFIDPNRKHKKQNRKDILELHEAYAEYKEFEKQKVNCVKCGNSVSKNKSFIYSGNFVCSNCASNIQSNYLQDWIPRETRSFTGTTRKCDNCKRRRPTSQFVYKTYSGDLDYNSLCRFCLLKKETCSHQTSFRKRYYNLYKYKRNNYFDNINAIIENDENDNNNNNDEDDEEYTVGSDKFMSGNRSKLLSKNAKPLSPQMIQNRPPVLPPPLPSHPSQEENKTMPRRRGRKRKNVEILLQQNKELEESSKRVHLSRTSTEMSNSSNTNVNSDEKVNTYNHNNSNIDSSNRDSNSGISNNNDNDNTIRTISFTKRYTPTFISSSINQSNINININLKSYDTNNPFRFTNRTSNSYVNTFLSADVNIPSSSSPPPSTSSSSSSIPPSSTPPPTSTADTDRNTEEATVATAKPVNGDIYVKLRDLLESKKYHNKPQVVKLEYEEMIVVSDIGSIPLNIEKAFKLYQSNSNMRVRCSVCYKSVLKDECIVDNDKCFVCKLCMKNGDDKFDWSVVENNRSVNDILCISCRMRKTVDQFLKLDEDNVICIQSICRHCFLTKGEELKNNR